MIVVLIGAAVVAQAVLIPRAFKVPVGRARVGLALPQILFGLGLAATALNDALAGCLVAAALTAQLVRVLKKVRATRSPSMLTGRSDEM